MSGSEFHQYVESGAVWKSVVEHDQVDPTTAHSGERLDARCHGRDLVRLAKERPDDLRNDRVIVYRQDLLTRGGRAAIATHWTASRPEHRIPGRNSRANGCGSLAW